MKTYSVVRRVAFAATAGALAGTLGCLLAAGIASSHDMAAMDGMGGADMSSMNHHDGARRDGWSYADDGKSYADDRPAPCDPGR